MDENKFKKLKKFLDTGKLTDKDGTKINFNKLDKRIKTIDLETAKSPSPSKHSKGGLKGNQKVIASKAPPFDKIGGNDFAVLRKEKAKGRGMGLQDEKVQPGKVMKADKGDFIKRRKEISKGFGKTMGVFPPIKKQSMGQAKDYKKYLEGLKEATKSSKAKQAGELAKKAAKSTTIGKIALGVAGAGIAAKKFIESDKFKNMLKDRKKEGKFPFKKKMGGGMMKRYNKGGGADTGTMGEAKSKLSTAIDAFERRRKKQKLQAPKRPPMNPAKAMGGGMIGASQMPGYSTGKSITVKTKLGRNKPTKMY